MTELKLDTPLQAWVYLNRVVEGPSRTLAALLQDYTPEHIAHGIYHQADWLGALRDETSARRDWLRQDEDIAAAEKVGARLITPESPEWPAAQLNSAFGFYAAGLPRTSTRLPSRPIPCGSAVLRWARSSARPSPSWARARLPVTALT